MKLLITILYWAFFSITSIILFVGALVIFAVTLPFDRKGILLFHYTRWWSLLEILCLPGCSIRVEGQEKIRPRTPYVIVANHQSMADIMALAAVRAPSKWVSKKENFRLPCIGWNMYLNRTIKIDRGNIRGVPRMMRACEEWLKQDVPLIFFPEGHRSRTGEMTKFHRGAFKLAVRRGCAVIPIVVNGTLPIFKGGMVAALPGRILIRVLDPIDGATSGQNAEKLKELVFSQMRDELATMRSASPSSHHKIATGRYN